MSRLPKTGVCDHCNRPIVKTRLTSEQRMIAKRAFLWATIDKGDFYCPQAGGECQHYPKEEY